MTTTVYFLNIWIYLSNIWGIVLIWILQNAEINSREIKYET